MFRPVIGNWNLRHPIPAVWMVWNSEMELHFNTKLPTRYSPLLLPWMVNTDPFPLVSCGMPSSNHVEFVLQKKAREALDDAAVDIPALRCSCLQDLPHSRRHFFLHSAVAAAPS